jgi:hypothetical protein
MNYIQDRLQEVFESTIESDQEYAGSTQTLDYYSLFCKAASNNNLYKLMGNNFCMFKCDLEGKDAIMTLFSISINNQEESVGAKNVAERVMEVVEATEKSFITIDNMKSEEVKEDKFVYVTMVKVLEGGV